MGPPVGPPPRHLLWRGFFLLAALDGLAWGLVCVYRPDRLFRFLTASREPPGADVLTMWQLLGALAAVQAGFALLLVVHPNRAGGLAVALLLGRLLGAGVWLWAWGSDRLALPARPVLLLAAHEALWVPGLAWFLLVRRRAAVPASGAGIE